MSVVSTDAGRDRRLKRIRGLSRVLDSAIRIPGTSFRVGLDPFIGLIPGLGDALGTALSGYIVVEATRFGASLSLLLRMLSNVGFEAIVGLVPGVGDVFDAIWKSNTRNLQLLERHLEDPETTHAKSSRHLALVLTGLVLLIGISVFGLVWLGGIVLQLLGI
ncbi:MAG: DUF4112 domain-containing protein [Gemmatimonadales bacterium]|nr:DUF4112 domain-containing protein [Gemmatimonadales bacterium]